MGAASGLTVSLPKDSLFVELQPEILTFETRECLLPGTQVSFSLVMEGHSLPLRAPVAECLVVDKDKAGFLYHARVSLAGLPGSDRQLIALFILKGRGSVGLRPAPVGR
jgi:hypothetical protein